MFHSNIDLALAETNTKALHSQIAAEYAVHVLALLGMRADPVGAVSIPGCFHLVEYGKSQEPALLIVYPILTISFIVSNTVFRS